MHAFLYLSFIPFIKPDINQLKWIKAWNILIVIMHIDKWAWESTTVPRLDFQLLNKWVTSSNKQFLEFIPDCIPEISYWVKFWSTSRRINIRKSRVITEWGLLLVLSISVYYLFTEIISNKRNHNKCVTPCFAISANTILTVFGYLQSLERITWRVTSHFSGKISFFTC